MNDTHEKEALGKDLLEKWNILKLFFPDMVEAEWVTDKETQLKGADYILHFKEKDNIFIDLKVGVGNYSKCAVEICQKTRDSEYKMVLTNTKDKITDYFLYVLVSGDTVDFVLLPYQPISHDCKWILRRGFSELELFDKEDLQTVKTSFNKSGIYILLDYAKVISNHKLPGAKCFCGLSTI